MQEIKVKGNEKLKVYINGKPQLEFMPKDILDSFVNSLYKQVIEKVEKKKKWYSKWTLCVRFDFNYHKNFNFFSNTKLGFVNGLYFKAEKFLSVH